MTDIERQITEELKADLPGSGLACTTLPGGRVAFTLAVPPDTPVFKLPLEPEILAHLKGHDMPVLIEDENGRRSPAYGVGSIHDLFASGPGRSIHDLTASEGPIMPSVK